MQVCFAPQRFVVIAKSATESPIGTWSILKIGTPALLQDYLDIWKCPQAVGYNMFLTLPGTSVPTNQCDQKKIAKCL